MAVPDFQTIMLPLMQFASDGLEHSLQESIEYIANYFELSEEDRNEILPSGRQTRLSNRVGWAKTHLSKAVLVKSTRRGYFRITERGHEVIGQNLQKISLKILDQFPEHSAFRSKKNSKPSHSVTEEVDKEQEETPTELIQNSYEQLRAELASELLETVLTCSPQFFESLVVDLLVGMGYGGTRAEAGKAIGGTGDEGIDGTINEDRLGLDIVYIQAKRWQNTIGRPDIQRFAGALQGKRARKGVFITTSDFTNTARDYVSRIDSKIILINGEMLTQLMIDYNIGVSIQEVYEIKRMDSDYFEAGL